MIATSRKPNVNAVLRFRLLGGYAVALRGETIELPRTQKARSLLAYLALRRGDTLRREALMTEFWPEAEPQSARNNLKTTLSAIRKTLRESGVDVDATLMITRDYVRWESAATIDSLEFERCSLGVDDERRYAIDVYRGEFMPGDDNEWAQHIRRDLAMRFEQMLRRELAAAPSPAIAERLLALDPFSDEAYTALIEHALQSGDRRAAQAIYRRYAVALQELGVEPPRDLAKRVGVRESARAPHLLPPFFGRADELAEIAHYLKSGMQAVLLTGVAGIGKTALAEETARQFARRDVTIADVTEADLADGGIALRQRLTEANGSILCATPDIARNALAAIPELPEVVVGPLAFDEVAVAVRRHVRDDAGALADALWKRANGYPLVISALADLLEDSEITAEIVERARLPRELERQFESSLRELGPDVADVAVLLALEPQLDHDDLAILLDWRVTRAIDAHELLRNLDAARPFYLEAALRTISPFRREHVLNRIADRLLLREDPTAKRRSAELLARLGKKHDAGRTFLEAANGFVAAYAWEHAMRAIGDGIEILEPVATSGPILDTLRELYSAKGNVLYQQGEFVSSLRAFDSVMERSTQEHHAAIRARTLLSMGHALVRADMLAPAWAVAQQAVKESGTLSDARSRLGAEHLLARVLRDRLQYDEAAQRASSGYEKAMDAREWFIATAFANLVIEIHRRMLRFDAATLWTTKQLEAAVLAGPIPESEARHMMGSVKATLHRFDEAISEFRQALILIEHHRRRQAAFVTPVAQLEWQLHHGLAHTYVASHDVERAIVESEWLLRSPWMFNSPFSSWQAISVCVDARLAAGSTSDIKAAQHILERVPRGTSPDPRVCIDTLARARVAACAGSDTAPALLREAYDALREAALVHEDQIHPYFYRLATSARGVDDTIAQHALESARFHERRLIEHAGSLWGLHGESRSS